PGGPPLPFALFLELGRPPRRLAPVPGVRPGTEARLRHRRVLMPAEDVLHVLGRRDEPGAGAAELVRGEVGRVARALHPDPGGVELVVLRALVELLDRLAGPPPLLPQ